MYDPSLHPHEPAGSSAGGQFVSKGGAAKKQNFTQDEKDALVEYSGHSFRDINLELRFAEGDIAPDIRGTVKKLDRAFAKSILTEDAKVYRAISNNSFSKIEKAYASGQLFEDKAFVSTTKDKAVLDEGLFRLKENILEVHVPKGSKAIDMESFAAFPEEKELLLNRGSKFKVRSISGKHAVIDLVN